MLLGSVGEWIIGNTFPFVVFGTFGTSRLCIVPSKIFLMQQSQELSTSNDEFLYVGAFWITFACTLVPWFNAYGAYVVDPAQAAPQMGNPGNPLGLMTPGFNASFAFFLLFMGSYLVPPETSPSHL